MKRAVFVFTILLSSSLVVYGEESPVPAPAAPSETPQQFEGFDLTGYGKDGTKAWDLKGDNADILGDVVKMTNVIAHAYEKEKMNVTAQYGTINKASGRMHLEKDVVITTETGARMTTESLDWERDKDLVTTMDPVVLTREGMTATGTGAIGHPNLKEAQLNEDVTVKINTETKDSKGEAITITCDGPMDMEYEKQKAVFHDNVVAIDAGRKLTADKMEVFFDTQAKQIKEMICTGNVSIRQGDNTSYSQRAVYNAAEKKLTLTGNPKLVLYTQEGGGLSFDQSKSANPDKKSKNREPSTKESKE